MNLPFKLIQGIDLMVGRELRFTPIRVPGRVLHIDADIIAYEMSYKFIWMTDEKSRRRAIMRECIEYTQALMYYAGADEAVMHTTPSGGTKGDRYNQARLKEYQGNRKDKVKPVDLEWCRNYLAKPPHNYWTGIEHWHQEADDGLAQALYKARHAGQEELCVCTSMDKDLRMLEGWHLTWDTYELLHTDKLGKLYYESKLKIDKDGKTREEKKYKGYGLKWFFFQMLIGDGADNISGLPKLTIPMARKYIWKDDKKKCAATACGPVKAYQILADVESVEECFEILCEVYKSYGDEIGFKRYDIIDEDECEEEFIAEVGPPITAKEAFLSEGYLLWMRELELANDFNRWIHHEGLVEIFKKYF